MRALRVACVGDNCIDEFLPPDGRSFVGGNAVNVAVQLCQLGVEAHYFGAVGTDQAGTRTIRVLTRKGVGVSHVRLVPGSTAFTHVAQTESGDRVFVKEDFGVCADYRLSAADFTALMDFDHVHIGWINDGGAARRRLAEMGTSVSQDLSVNNTAVNLGVPGLTIAFASAGEDRSRALQLADGMLQQGARLVVATMGALGSIAKSDTEFAQTGVSPVEVVDTTGAGDAFIAGFLSQFLRGSGLLTSLETGRDHAAHTCSHVGGFPQIMSEGA